ncbi:DUF1993 family protein [Stagnihabitans tardus]|uniref:DUF1993 family protein n=1 Tax=Stagnihabitans tardus TaxID=2699202 RepID=A0AAE5BTP6_9RHOB|nr:DUF1993 family protein [Stagnihabitans tardus]NBZ86931.1 DUF1993 family protein [Stagnihabitans tardus]
MSLYTASVPVFRHYLARAQEMAEGHPEALEARIADSFPAGQHFATAAGFALRVACPLAGREMPDLPRALSPRLAVVRATLGAMRPEEFIGAETRRIQHRAGFAELDQGAEEFLYLYGLPNFFFHMTMGYAALRGAGVPLGKADFDGFHAYPADFHF